MVNHEILAQELSEQNPGLSKKDALAYVVSFINIMEGHLVAGEQVKLHKSMVLETKEMKAKKAYDGFSKKYFEKPVSRVLRVRPLTKLDNKLKEQK